jgi:hypothetical protein
MSHLVRFRRTQLARRTQTPVQCRGLLSPSHPNHGFLWTSEPLSASRLMFHVKQFGCPGAKTRRIP